MTWKDLGQLMLGVAALVTALTAAHNGCVNTQRIDRHKEHIDANSEQIDKNTARIENTEKKVEAIR